MVRGESASALASATSARFSFSRSGGRDGRRCNSSVQRIDSKEAPPTGIEVSSGSSFFDLADSVMSSPPCRKDKRTSVTSPSSFLLADLPGRAREDTLPSAAQGEVKG